MHQRSFAINDEVTVSNLEYLDRLSTLDQSLDQRMLGDLLVAIIEVHRLLPVPVQRLIPIGNCFTGDRHWGINQEGRDAIWRQVRADLSKGLDLVLSTESDLSSAAMERPETRGERILKLCEKLRANDRDTGVVLRLVSEGAGSDVGSDAEKLLKLFKKKRVGGAAAHDAEVNRLIDHIERVATRLHHKP